MPSIQAKRPRPKPREHGAIAPFVILAVPTLIVLVGFVSDGGGQIEASSHAQHIASSAARYATGEISGEAVSGGDLTINPVAAEQAAISYVESTGLEGSAHVEGDTITVTATGHYQTKFINLIGIQTLQYQATAHATLINGPTN